MFKNIDCCYYNKKNETDRMYYSLQYISYKYTQVGIPYKQ